MAVPLSHPDAPWNLDGTVPGDAGRRGWVFLGFFHGSFTSTPTALDLSSYGSSSGTGRTVQAVPGSTVPHPAAAAGASVRSLLHGRLRFAHSVLAMNDPTGPPDAPDAASRHRGRGKPTVMTCAPWATPQILQTSRTKASGAKGPLRFTPRESSKMGVDAPLASSQRRWAPPPPGKAGASPERKKPQGGAPRPPPPPQAFLDSCPGLSGARVA